MSDRSGNRCYVLDHLGVSHPEPDVARWSQWMTTHERHVAQAEICEIWISTVFLGLDHNHRGDGPPILFETMIFGGRHDEYQQRYATRTEALLGHARIVQMVRETLKDGPPADMTIPPEET